MQVTGVSRRRPDGSERQPARTPRCARPVPRARAGGALAEPTPGAAAPRAGDGPLCAARLLGPTRLSSLPEAVAWTLLLLLGVQMGAGSPLSLGFPPCQTQEPDLQNLRDMMLISARPPLHMKEPEPRASPGSRGAVRASAHSPEESGFLGDGRGGEGAARVSPGPVHPPAPRPAVADTEEGEGRALPSAPTHSHEGRPRHPGRLHSCHATAAQHEGCAS